MKNPPFSKYAEEGFRRINYMDPLIQEVCRELLCRWAMEDLYWRLPDDSGKRTADDQLRLYKKRPRVTWVLCPKSFHCLGLALDFVPLRQLGPIQWEARFRSAKLYERMATIAMELGFTWGKAVWGRDSGHIHWAEGLVQKDRVDDILGGMQPHIPDFTPVKKPEVLRRALQRLARRGVIPYDSVVLKQL